MRRAGGWAACLVLLVTSAAHADPGSLDLRVARASFAFEPASRLRVEGARLELLLPGARPVAATQEGRGERSPEPQAASRMPMTLFLREAALEAPAADGRAAISLTGSLARSDVEGTLSVVGSVGRAPAGRGLLERPWELEGKLRGVDAEAVRQLLPSAWGISAAWGVVDADLALRGRPATTLGGQLSIQMGRGGIEAFGVRQQAPARFATHISVGADGGTRLTDAHLSAAAVEVAGLHGTGLRSTFSSGAGTLELLDCVVAAFGGTSRHHGQLHFEEVPRFELESQVSGVDTAQLFEGLDPEAAPRLDATSKLRGRWTGQPDWWKSLEGEAQIDLRGGLLPGSELLRSVSSALLRRIPGVKGPQAPANPPRTALKQAVATFALGDGVARTDDLRVDTAEYVLNASGRIDADLGVDMTGRVGLTVRGLDTVLSLAGFGLGLETLTRMPIVPVRITGTLREPHFDSDVSSLPVAAWKLVPRTLGAARGAAEKGAGALLDAAEGAGGLLLPGKERKERPQQEGR